MTGVKENYLKYVSVNYFINKITFLKFRGY